MQITARHVAAGATAGSILAAAVAFIQPWEGFFPKPYFDIVGVKTVCYGATAADNVDLTRVYTKEECAALLRKTIVKYDNGIKDCLTRDIPDGMHIAFLSAAYNVGVSGFCKSSMARRVNEGDLRGACEALMMWNKAGGRVVKGLDNRRRAERKLCLESLQ
jgi:lysozyme